MTKEEIKKLDDKTLIKKVFEALNVKNLKDFEEKEDIPFNTSSKWNCKDGIPTELPSRGGYRQLFVSLLTNALNQKELNDYREYFKLQKKIESEYR
jgi:hypothetical protein